MDNHDFLQIYETMKVSEISDTLKAIKNRSASPAALEDFQKGTCALVYDVHEELKLINHNLEHFPLWSALRLLGLETGLHGRVDYDTESIYTKLDTLESHVPSDPISFPFKSQDIYPIDQNEIDSLEFKKLLSKTDSGIKKALEKCKTKYGTEFRIAELAVKLLQIVKNYECEANYQRGMAQKFGGLSSRAFNLHNEAAKAAEVESKRYEQETIMLVQDFSPARLKTVEAVIQLLKTVEDKRREAHLREDDAHNRAFNVGRRFLRPIYFFGFIALFIIAVILFNSIELVPATLCFSGVFILYLFGPWFAFKPYIEKENNLLKESVNAASTEIKKHEQEAIKLIQDLSSGGRKTNEPAEEDSDEPSKPKFLKLENGSIHFECSYCSQPLEIDVTGGGTEIKCPECGERQKVPTSN